MIQTKQKHNKQPKNKLLKKNQTKNQVAMLLMTLN